MPELPPGARAVPLTGLAQRITQAARYVISGVKPETWFGPMQPLAPMAPQDPEQGVRGRQWDYPTGINLNYNPRSDQAIGFAELRALADSADVVRILIESRKDQMAALEWVVVPRIAAKGAEASIWYKMGANAHPELSDDVKSRTKAITEFLQYPDREHSWDHWVKEWMEEVFVIDAPSILRQRSRDSTLYALEIIDGSTIKPLVGADGRTPKYPDPAYQQVLHGVPAADFTNEELLYVPWNLRSNRIYGYSKVEQILVTVNTMIRRSLFQLKYYTEGSQPDAFMGLPKEWNLQQIKDYQDYMDSLLSGNLSQRRKLRMVPGEFKYQEAKSPPLKDIFDEYLARVACYAFAVAPDPFIEHVSRGAVEKSHTRALEEGLEPNQRYIKAVIDRIIREDFDSPDLEFKYIDNREQDPKAQMEIDVGYAKAGIYSIDEVRVTRGKPPLGGPASVPMLATPSGYVPLATMTAPGASAAIAASGGPAAQAIEHLRGTEGGNGSSASNNGAGNSNSNDNSGDAKGSKSDNNNAAKLLKSESLSETVIPTSDPTFGAESTTGSARVVFEVAPDDVRERVFSAALTRMTEGSCRSVKKTVPIYQIVATQSHVSRILLDEYRKFHAKSGKQLAPAPSVLKFRSKYYLLDAEGHYKAEVANMLGAMQVEVCELQVNLDPEAAISPWNSN